jgi:hypothetical protein
LLQTSLCRELHTQVALGASRCRECALGVALFGIHRSERRFRLRDLVAQRRLVVLQLTRHRGELRDRLVAAGVGVVEHRGAPRRVQDVGPASEDAVENQRTALVCNDGAHAPERGEVLLLCGQGVDRSPRRGLLVLQLVVPSLGGVVRGSRPVVGLLGCGKTSDDGGERIGRGPGRRRRCQQRDGHGREEHAPYEREPDVEAHDRTNANRATFDGLTGLTGGAVGRVWRRRRRSPAEAPRSRRPRPVASTPRRRARRR